MEIEIRKATPADAEALYAIETECFTDPWSLKSFEDAIGGTFITYFTAVAENGEAVGFAGLSVAADEGEIVNIAVSSPFRKSGIGDKLMSKAIAEAEERGCSAVYLEVRESNESARKLYTKYGFEIIGVRKNYYTAPREDAVLMKKTIK